MYVLYRARDATGYAHSIHFLHPLCELRRPLAQKFLRNVRVPQQSARVTVSDSRRPGPLCVSVPRDSPMLAHYRPLPWSTLTQQLLACEHKRRFYACFVVAARCFSFCWLYILFTLGNIPSLIEDAPLFVLLKLRAALRQLVRLPLPHDSCHSTR